MTCDPRIWAVSGDMGRFSGYEPLPPDMERLLYSVPMSAQADSTYHNAATPL